jgi:acyl-CoA synthetase (NDP forming)
VSDPRVRLLFEPQSVAIIGASSIQQSVRTAVAQHREIEVCRQDLSGQSARGRISGLKCYPTVSDLPEAPDVAILMVDARLSPDVLEECGRKNVKTAIVSSAGFSESGPEGQSARNSWARSPNSTIFASSVPTATARSMSEKHSLRLRSCVRAAAQSRSGRDCVP